MSACRSRQEGQGLKASPDYTRPCSQNTVTGQHDGSVGNLVTPISSLDPLVLHHTVPYK